MATSLEGFIQQLAVAYVARGYFFYVTGTIPPGRDPQEVDNKLLDKYGIRLSKYTRHRRKQLGQASVQYLRFENFFILISTTGQHPFFNAERDGGEGRRIRDVRRQSIRFAGYSISSRRKHGDGTKRVVHVRIDKHTYLEIRDTFVDLAPKRSLGFLAYQFEHFPFEAYAPVRRQIWNIFNRVNNARKKSGLETLSRSCLRLKRRPVRPFDLLNGLEVAAELPIDETPSTKCRGNNNSGNSDLDGSINPSSSPSTRESKNRTRYFTVEQSADAICGLKCRSRDGQR